MLFLLIGINVPYTMPLLTVGGCYGDNMKNWLQ